LIDTLHFDKLSASALEFWYRFTFGFVLFVEVYVVFPAACADLAEVRQESIVFLR
jgi:hypothetical protein